MRVKRLPGSRWDRMLEAAAANPDTWVATTSPIPGSWSAIRSDIERAMARTGIYAAVRNDHGHICLQYRPHQRAAQGSDSVPYDVLPPELPYRRTTRQVQQVLAALRAAPGRPVRIPAANRNVVERIRIAARRAGMRVRTVKLNGVIYMALAEVTDDA